MNLRMAMCLVSVFGLAATAAAADLATGNVIFIHPDGSAAQTWGAYRMLDAGPDGEIAWDRLPEMALYRGHMKDRLAATSHGGATTHAYGVKVPADSYGMHGKEPLKALSGYAGSVMQEALAAGVAVGVVNSGHIAEPGTGVYLASSKTRWDTEAIARSVIESGAHVIMSGGETMLMPKGVKGFHGQPGIRKDGRNLIEEARERGYTVVYDRGQLEELDTKNVDKLLGVFAAGHTFHDKSEAELAAAGLPLYEPGAPSVAEMMNVAIEILARSQGNYFLVVEEEGSDNFANSNNAAGTFEALRRADAAIGAAHERVRSHPDTLLILAADSDAGGMQVVVPGYVVDPGLTEKDSLPPWMFNGAPVDGRSGTHGRPFVSAPDRFGKRHYFGVAWAGFSDFTGGILARAAGLNSERLGRTADNTDIYRMTYRTLFGKEPGD
jgi:alkaline phosphatase